MLPAPVYLDHHATTPVDPRVVQVVVEAMAETFGNANSTQHRFGQSAAGLIRKAAQSVAELLNCEPEDVRFTSGASEALRLALAYACERRSTAPLKVVASTVEHPALIEELERGVRLGWWSVTWAPVDQDGLIQMDRLRDILTNGADLLCLMAANNEVGAVQPVEAAAALAHDLGVEILVDATQAAGRIPLDVRGWAVDYLVISAHKIYGPKGVGALIGPELGEAHAPQRYNVHLATPNTPGIAGLGEACRLCAQVMETEEPRIEALRDRLQANLLSTLPGAVVNGPLKKRLAANLHISLPDLPNDAIVAHLADRVALSTGAACASGADAPSHVLRAMGLEAWRQEGALRISLGRFTTIDDIDHAAAAILDAARDVGRLARTRS